MWTEGLLEQIGADRDSTNTTARTLPPLSHMRKGFLGV